MAGDISKHTITVLVILTVVISFLGTWVVMSEVSKVKLDGKTAATNEPAQQQTLMTGKVMFGVESDNVNNKGEVALNIEE